VEVVVSAVGVVEDGADQEGDGDAAEEEGEEEQELEWGDHS